MSKTIITAALTGAVTPAGYNIPETPEKIAEDAYACWKAGAAIVHLHMRDEQGLGTMDAARFKKTIELIRAYEDCDVVIVAGCGIHNCGGEDSRHDGIHTFYVGKHSHVKYTEKHYGDGDGTGGRIMNPQTVVYLDEGASIQMETTQIRGIDSTKRETKIVCGKDAEAVVTERLMTHGDQVAESDMEISLDGDGARGRVISRSVAKGTSRQVFYPKMVGNAACFGHVQCDSIIMDDAHIESIPAIVANSTEAQLIHEAAIGKIAGEQLIKLMTLGLTEKEAEEQIVKGFLK